MFMVCYLGTFLKVGDIVFSLSPFLTTGNVVAFGLCCLFLSSLWSACFASMHRVMAWETRGGATVCLWHLPPAHLLPPPLLTLVSPF